MANYVRFRRADGTTGAGLLEGDNIGVIREPFWDETVRTGEAVARSEVALLAPCEPRSVVCVGLNYLSHLHGRLALDRDGALTRGILLVAGDLLPELHCDAHASSLCREFE